jgi:hypothetical protein
VHGSRRLPSNDAGSSGRATSRAWEQIHARIAGAFARAEPRGRVLAYLRGLPGQLERMFGWMLAEARFELQGIKPPTRSYTVT